MCSPLYAGLGSFPAIVPDEEWVSVTAGVVRNEGIEQFWVNLLHILRATFAEGCAYNLILVSPYVSTEIEWLKAETT